VSISGKQANERQFAEKNFPNAERQKTDSLKIQVDEPPFQTKAHWYCYYNETGEKTIVSDEQLIGLAGQIPDLF
jgi:hypothetical protein